MAGQKQMKLNATLISKRWIARILEPQIDSAAVKTLKSILCDRGRLTWFDVQHAQSD